MRHHLRHHVDGILVDNRYCLEVKLQMLRKCSGSSMLTTRPDYVSVKNRKRAVEPRCHGDDDRRVYAPAAKRPNRSIR